MCMLTYSPPGTRPDFDKLREAGINNPDGFGFAIIDWRKCRIVQHRSLDLEESLAAYSLALSLHEGPSLWHARWATHGELTIANVHPFMVDDGATVLAHNGIMPLKERDTLSDTATFAADYWPLWSRGAIDDATEYGQLAQVIGAGSKLVILTVDPRYACSAYIVNEKDGHWVDGTWYSNYSYTKRTFSSWTWEKNADGKWVRGDEDDEYADDYVTLDEVKCTFCESVFFIDYDDDDEHFCPDCQTCYYCDKYSTSCRCWVKDYEDKQAVSDDYEGRTFAQMLADDREWRELQKEADDADYEYELRLQKEDR